MILCVISQRVTRWEKPNSNPYWLLGAPSTLQHPALLLLLSPGPSSASQPFLPQSPLLSRKAEQCLLPQVARNTKIPRWALPRGLCGRTTSANLPNKAAVWLYQGKSGSDDTSAFVSPFSEARLRTSFLWYVTVSAVGMPSCSESSSIVGHNMVGWHWSSQHALLTTWLWSAEVRFLTLNTVSWKTAALILNANYWNVQLVICIF